MNTNKRDRLEMAQRLVDVMEAGDDPITFLKDQGYGNPTQAYHDIKNYVRDHDPELFDRFPAKRYSREKKPVETPEPPAAPAAKKVETPEAPTMPKICQPVEYDHMLVREVEGNFARYRRSDVGNVTYIDVELTDCCDPISFTVDQWRNFLKEQSRAAVILGVQL